MASKKQKIDTKANNKAANKQKGPSKQEAKEDLKKRKIDFSFRGSEANLAINSLYIFSILFQPCLNYFLPIWSWILI